MTTVRIEVNTTGSTYPVLLGAGAKSELPRVLTAEKCPSRFFLVTDANVDALHSSVVEDALQQVGRPFAKTVVPPGEPSKSPEQLVSLWRELIQEGCDRSSCVIALGGGVVGDLAGFVAATTLRGIEFVQVPTTLLAMVDASVGGKTGIDLPEGKNLVGAFHQPRAVVMDLDFLETLPERELRAGWAEVIKTAAIRDASLFASLESDQGALCRREPAALAQVIEACVKIKAEVVRADEREAGLRRILNFGHTLAHGLEAVGDYRDLLHGEAVALGMVFAAELGASLEVTRPEVVPRLRACLGAYGLPVTVDGISPDDVLEVMERDKKKGPGGIRWVFLSELGKTVVTDQVSRDLMGRRLESFLANEAPPQA